MTTTPQDQPLKPLVSDIYIYAVVESVTVNDEIVPVWDAHAVLVAVRDTYEAERVKLTARVQELEITTERRKAIKYAVAELLTHNYEVSTYYAEILERMADDA